MPVTSHFFIKFLIFTIILFLKSFASADMISVNCNDKAEMKRYGLENGKPLREVVDKDFFKIFEKMSVFRAKIDDHKFGEFQNEILSVNVFSVPKQHGLLGWGNYSLRQEAANFDHCIVVSEDLLETTGKTERELSLYLLLHEAMGAAGFSDLNFQFTSVLMMPDLVLRDNEISLPVIHIIREKSTNRRKQLFQVFSTNESILLADGGGSVVGSGGDSLLLSLKTQMLTNLFSKVILNRQMKVELNPRQNLLAFFNFIRNASIDYVEEVFMMGDSITDPSNKTLHPFVLNSMDQQLIPGISELHKPILVIPIGKNTTNHYALQVYLSQLILLRNLSAFLQTIQGRSFLNTNVDFNKFEVDSHLRKYLETLVDQNNQRDFLLRKQYQFFQKRVGDHGGSEKVAYQFKGKIVNDLYALLTKNKEVFGNMIEHLSLTSDFGTILLMSELFRDFESAMDIPDTSFYQLSNEDKD